MFKKSILAFLSLTLIFTLSGCISFGGDEVEVNSQVGVFISPDQGENWLSRSSLLTPGAKEGSIAGVDILTIAMDPSDYNTMYLGTRENGVFYSYNGGEGWTQSKSLLELTTGKVYSMAVDPENKCTVYAGVDNKIFKTQDCSRTWENVFTSPKSDEVIRSILVDWYNPQTVYAAARDGSIYKSTTNGQSWIKLKDFKKDIRELEMDNTDSRILYLVTRSGGLYISSDAGATWETQKEKLEEFSGDALQGFGLEVAQDSQKTLLYLSKYGLLKSVDRGENWVKLNLLTGQGEIEFYDFAVDPNDSDNMYLADSQTLYRTLDGGQTWETKNLPTTSRLASLKVHTKDGNLLIAGFKVPEE